MTFRPPEPRWIRDLPRFYGGRFAAYKHLPHFAAASCGTVVLDRFTRSRALGLRRRCTVCGCRVGDLVWNAFTTDGMDYYQEGAGCWHPGDVWTDNTPGPMHTVLTTARDMGQRSWMRRSRVPGAGRSVTRVCGRGIAETARCLRRRWRR